MIFDNMNTENRNNSNMPQHYPRNSMSRSRNTAARQTCCSFCHQTGHNISNCTDERLQIFENICNQQKIVFEYDERPMRSFNDWLMNYYLENSNIVRAYAIRYCGSTTRSNININISNVTIHFYDEDHDLDDVIEDNISPFLLPYEVQDQLLMEFLQNNVFVSDATNTTMVPLSENDAAEILGNLEILASSIVNGNPQPRKFAIQTRVIREERVDPTCECSICYETFNFTDFVKLNCNHTFCKECLKGSLTACNRFQDPGCALCRTTIREFTYRDESVQEEFSSMIV